MESTSIAAGPPETESTNTSHETAPSSSTSVISTSPSLCSSCFDWLSSFIPWRSLQSDSRASTPTSDHEAPASSTGSKAAFDGIAPSASTSASKRTQKPCYDVFINHRGPDVKDTLASVLFAMLTGMLLSVFLDSQELKYGDFLPRTIEAAMETALLHIAIFSKRYAESPWCLAELSFMLKSGAKIIPIFYQVDPNDLRWVHQGKGMYAEAFRKHEQKGRYTPELLQEWKSALHVVSFFSGQIVKTKEDEMRLLKTIASCVLKEINSNVPLVVAKHPVGLEEIVEDFKANTLQSVHGNQNAQIVGIWGMGGSGKTTLAKKLYNEISSSMERSSFVFNIRDAATKGLLYEKQKKLLNDLGIQGLPFDNIEEGMQNISRAFRSARVLIVLDDVDNRQQLDALLPTKDNLEKGSLIIVTTRACDVLKSWGISSIYKMKELNPLHAEQLFCWHAFLKSYPPDGFEKLVEQFLKVCKGLPLSIKIFGAELHGESRKEHWESQLEKISETLSDDIKQILKLSYDTLDGEEKEMFLDAACFFIGKNSSLAIEVWNGIKRGALRSWERLLNRCFVELDNENCINMHDHLRDLGRDIANKQSPYRLWYPQQIIDIQKQVKKRSGIHGIITTSNQVINDFEELPEMIRKDKEVEEFRFSCSHGKLMVGTNGGIRSLKPSLFGLKYLVISGDFLNQEMGDISRELVWLRWFQIGRRDLPSGLPLKKLRVLELYEERDKEDVHHLEELWGKSADEAPVQLRQLLISNCHKFQGFPNSIGHLIHLKKIVIICGHNVTSLPDEFFLLQSLEHLVLYDCRRLSSLPYNFGNLRNLRHLNLSGCAKLRRLPVTIKHLRLLEHLNLGSCEDLTFASEDLNFLENIARLEFLNLGGCKKLEELPRHITNQVSLRELDFSYTSIRELPDNIGQLSRLTKMTIKNVLLTSLPKSLGDLSSLTNLEIRRCDKLECLPDSLGDLSSLTNLEISRCDKLECLPDSLGDLSSLTNLEISCYKLECLPDSFGDLSSLTNLEISCCDKLECLPDSLGDLSSLTNLKIHFCPKLECLPDSLGDLSSLTNLKIGSCPKLECLPVSIRQLSNLQELYIFDCPISECDYGWSNLETLDVGRNHQLKEIEALPMTLKSIHLENCEMLKNIPNFAGFTSLKEFHLEGCYGIEKIEGLENCTRLEKLIVETCWEVPGIESLEHMQDLKRLILKANNISVIEHCIQRIQKWPDERIIICARAVPDAVSLLHSSLPPNLVILHSISNIAPSCMLKIGIYSMLELVLEGDAIMFCFVINCVSSQLTLYTALDGYSLSFKGHVRKGRWLLVGVATQRNSKGVLHIRTSDPCYGGGGVEKGLVVRGEEQTVREAVRRLLPLFSL